MAESHCKLTRSHIIFDPEIAGVDPLILLDESWLANGNSAHGPHGSVIFFCHKQVDYAWKRYQRRGLMAKLLKDHYGWRRVPGTRMWREYHMLARLHELGLPAPRPVAARCRYQNLLTYSGDLITVRLPDTVNLRDQLQQQPLDPALWFETGKVIATFHRHDVFHADLNASNILVQAGGAIHLVDFDNGRLVPHSSSWKPGNLARLQHSLSKLKQRLSPFYFDTQDWSRLMAGYLQ